MIRIASLFVTVSLLNNLEVGNLTQFDPVGQGGNKSGKFPNEDLVPKC
jgi:hypothetical protein